MKLIFAALFIFTGLQTQSKAEESIESLHKRWISTSMEGKYEESLHLGMRLFHKALEPPIFGPGCGKKPAHVTMLFDLAQNLIHLSRWKEAEFCLKTFLVHIQSTEELEITFGPDFSKERWLQENRIDNQPFYKQTLPEG